MNTKNIIVAIMILAVVIVGGYFLFTQNQKPITTTVGEENGQPPNPNPQPPPPGQTTGANHEVIYTDSGYSPSSITVKKGDTVTFKNQSSFGMWTSSAMHPTHIIYSGTSLNEHCPDPDNTSFDECRADQPGESWSFTFNKTGTWRYHNHAQASDFGTVIVEE